MSLDSISGSNPANHIQSATEEATPPKPTDSTVSMSENVSSLAKLKEISPEAYDAMMKSMANDINSKQEEHVKKQKEIKKEAERR